MTRLRVIDIETTGTEPTAEVIEIGQVDVVMDESGVRVEPPKAELFRPLSGIPPETMALYHITEDDFTEDALVCTPDNMRRAVSTGEAPDVLVAHNCAFERQFITEAVTDGLPWICTYKVALHVWPDAPRHTNQVLRYWRTLQLDRVLAMPPHRAGPDAWVTAHLELLRFASIEQMLAWTQEPKSLPTVPFGKHRGLPWSKAPLDYLQWMITKTEMDADVLWNAQREIDNRAIPRLFSRFASAPDAGFAQR